MEDPPPEEPQRRYHRVVRRRPVVLKSSDGEATCSFARLETVGRGGALLLCDRPLPVGCEVEIVICLAGGVIRARGRVLYHREIGDPEDEGVGLGVEFLAVTGGDAELLDQLTTPTAFEYSVPGSAPSLPPDR